MEYGLLLLITAVVAGGVAGGLLGAWSCHRRILVLEETWKVMSVCYEDRLKQIEKIITRQDKSAAATIKWSKKAAEEEALAAILAKPANGATPAAVAAHPWDPRTWGDSK
jgi:hypothetical protein